MDQANHPPSHFSDMPILGIIQHVHSDPAMEQTNKNQGEQLEISRKLLEQVEKQTECFGRIADALETIAQNIDLVVVGHPDTGYTVKVENND